MSAIILECPVATALRPKLLAATIPRVRVGRAAGELWEELFSESLRNAREETVLFECMQFVVGNGLCHTVVACEICCERE